MISITIMISSIVFSIVIIILVSLIMSLFVLLSGKAPGRSRPRPPQLSRRAADLGEHLLFIVLIIDVLLLCL